MEVSKHSCHKEIAKRFINCLTCLLSLWRLANRSMAPIASQLGQDIELTNEAIRIRQCSAFNQSRELFIASEMSINERETRARGSSSAFVLLDGFEKKKRNLNISS
jgi:hypothetical protein